MEAAGAKPLLGPSESPRVQRALPVAERAPSDVGGCPNVSFCSTLLTGAGDRTSGENTVL